MRGMPERFTIRWLLFVTFVVAVLLTAAIVVPPWIILSAVLCVSWVGIGLWVYLLMTSRL